MTETLTQMLNTLSLHQEVKYGDEKQGKDRDIEFFYKNLGIQLEDGLFGYNEPLDELLECMKETSSSLPLPLEGSRLIYRENWSSSAGYWIKWVVKGPQNFYHMYTFSNRTQSIMGATKKANIRYKTFLTFSKAMKCFFGYGSDIEMNIQNRNYKWN